MSGEQTSLLDEELVDQEDEPVLLPATVIVVAMAIGILVILEALITGTLYECHQPI